MLQFHDFFKWTGFLVALNPEQVKEKGFTFSDTFCTAQAWKNAKESSFWKSASKSGGKNLLKNTFFLKLLNNF